VASGDGIGHKMIRKILAILGPLAVVLAVLIGIAYHRDIQAAQARVASGSKLINTPCGWIESADEGTGSVLFAIHGAGGGFDQSLELARDFLPSGFRVVAPSRFGYLRTPTPADASPMAQADAHACLLDALKLQKVLVMGGSMGAPSAMQLCLRHPERYSALVLLFPMAYAPRPEKQPPPRPSRFAQFLMNTTLKSDFVFWVASKIARDTVMKAILATPPADFKNASPEERPASSKSSATSSRLASAKRDCDPAPLACCVFIKACAVWRLRDDSHLPIVQASAHFECQRGTQARHRASNPTYNQRAESPDTF
jgi:2-hydroxy-6-oxonona-2,4-dienedioate hydrolase